MAKKKSIKAAPVLRSGNEQTKTRTYQIMDPWKDRGLTNLVDVKAVDGEITEVKVNGEPAGGGAVAIVTFASEPTAFKTALPVINADGTYTSSDGWATDEFTSFPVDLKIPLPAIGSWHGDEPPTCTGGVTFDPDTHALTVTGNGTITR